MELLKIIFFCIINNKTYTYFNVTSKRIMLQLLMELILFSKSISDIRFS